MADRESELVKIILDAINKAFGRSRILQQSPILPDVWAEYVRDASEISRQCEGLELIERLEGLRVDLLFNVAEGSEPSAIARALREGIRGLDRDPLYARIASNRTNVVANLTFMELVCVAVPVTRWWQNLPEPWRNGNWQAAPRPFENSTETDFFSFVATVGLLGVMLEQDNLKAFQAGSDELAKLAKGLAAQRDLTLDVQRLLDSYRNIYRYFEIPLPGADDSSIARVQLNRRSDLTVHESRRTIKADASQNVFNASAANIRWAVLDCGIDARHDAFRPRPAAPLTGATMFKSRVVKTYDFTILRDLQSGRDIDAVGRKIEQEDRTALDQMADSMTIDWPLIRRITEIPHFYPLNPDNPETGAYRKPGADHGTHVAGIIGADWEKDPNGKPITGICPDIELIDIRIFANNSSDEFSVITALQFIGYLNRVSEVLYVHGINLSFSFAHDVRNFACGRTPICNACERLVDNGVVVVAAAGNAGYGQVFDQPTLADRYAQMTITDPGNAEAVITVGSTHRTKPHTYGVSFFSSRGPTGDGRIKPDVIAPGEKILSTVPDNQSAEMDGTSMAAPHVSGGAAILMARHPELIGRAREVKRILCDSATDLGRERYFQGAGLLDILRALQSV